MISKQSKTLLIIAAGPLQIPAIEEARKLGLRTVAMDANPNAPGMAIADSCHTMDILDAAAVVDVARTEKVDGVMTLCADAPVRTVAAVGAELNLLTLSPLAAANATDKRLMRRVLSAYAVSVPKFCEVDSVECALSEAAELGYPVALKVPCSSGSRGVYRITSSEELRRRFMEARRYQETGHLLVEEWIEGPEVSVEGVCFDGHVHVIQVTDKLLFPGAFPVEAGHTQPSMLPIAIVEQIHLTTEAAVRAMQLTNCAFHAELKIAHNGPKVIEVGARLGGDRISTHLTPLSTGINLVQAAIQIAIGESPDLTTTVSRGAAIRYFCAPRCGTIESVGGLNEISDLAGIQLLYDASERSGPLRPGFVIGEICSSLDRYGHVIFTGDDAIQAAARADHAISLVKFNFRQAAG